MSSNAQMIERARKLVSRYQATGAVPPQEFMEVMMWLMSVAEIHLDLDYVPVDSPTASSR